MWCFIGIEVATIPADSIYNPNKTIPTALIFGTICIAIVYLINNFAIMGLMNGSILSKSKAPYVDAVKIMFPGNYWHLVISIIEFIFCISSLNTWVLSSGQVIFGLAKDKFMPAFFAKKNRYGSPFWGILSSSSGTLILLILTSNKNFSKQIIYIIDFSVVSFLFIYLVCSLAFIKIIAREGNYYKLLLGIIPIIFCCWMILEIPINVLLISSLFTLSGIPIYLFWYCKKVF